MAGNIAQLNEEQFKTQVENGKGLILVDFWAPWCGPCRMVGPILEELATELAGKVTITKLNVDDNGSIAGKYQVSGIPSMILFRDGKPIDTLVGAYPKPSIREFILKHAK